MTALEQRRLRIAKITVAVLAILLVILAICKLAEDTASTTQLSSYLQQPDAQSDTDALGLDSEQIRFIKASENGSILWYQSDSALPETAMYLDKSLVTQGWQALPQEQQGLLSYSYPASSANAGGSLLISITEQPDGCSVIVNLM